jgi:hypothetical protein
MHPLIRTARITGLLYLGLAAAGALGFLITRPRLVAAEPAGTLANLTTNPGLARAAVVFELLTVLTQALAAAWFYRLFHRADRFAAAGIAAFGLVNAVAVLISAALLGTAAEIARAPYGDAAATVQTLYLASGHLWTAGGLFFGLWLIPMGRCVLRSGWMPRPLGRLLIGGGVGYVLSAFLGYLAPGVPLLTGLLVVPATVGEFWMIGYLLIRGVNAPDGELRPVAEPAEDTAAHPTTG